MNEEQAKCLLISDMFLQVLFLFLIHADKHTLNLADKYFTQILCCH